MGYILYGLKEVLKETLNVKKEKFKLSLKIWIIIVHVSREIITWSL